MTEPKPRPAEVGQVPAVAACARAAYAKYVSPIGREPAPMVADFPAAIAAGEVSVLADARDVVGFIGFRTGPGHLFVENVAVETERRHKDGFDRVYFKKKLA